MTCETKKKHKRGLHDQVRRKAVRKKNSLVREKDKRAWDKGRRDKGELRA